MIPLKFLWKNKGRNFIIKVVKTIIIVFLIVLFWLLNFLPKKKEFTFIRVNLTQDSNIPPMYNYHKALGDKVKLIDLRKKRSSFKILYSSYRSKYIYLDQNIFTLFIMPLNKNIIVQLGHGSCRIKGVGRYANPAPMSQLITKGKSVNDIITAATIKTAEEVGYAYDVEFKNVLITNEPRKVRDKINNGSGVLFSPTYRIIDGKYLYPEKLLDLDKLKFLGKKLYIKHHPVTSNKIVPSWATDASKYSIEECVSKTNIIISDYSTITSDYISLSTKSNIISHIPDINHYEKITGLMPSWKLFMSNQMSSNTDELIEAIRKPSFTNQDLINKIGLTSNSDSLKKIRDFVINYKK